MGVRFAKGHGTQNDFVLLVDPDGVLDVTAARVRALCDRRRGLGADGVLRIVRTASLGTTTVGATGKPGGPATAGGAPEWFMDYRNGDGSIAEMCGNGVRVYARHLVDAGLAPPGDLLLGTRAGVRPVVVPATGDVTVDMGRAVAGVTSKTTVRTSDGGATVEGVAVDVGNPHLACVSDLDLDTLDLTTAPEHDGAVFPNGVNVEFVRVAGPGVIAMRVHERGVGETRSCGTGTVAATVAALLAAGETTGERLVDTRGGRVCVEIAERTAWLAGPAEIVATGELSDAWWTAADPA